MVCYDDDDDFDDFDDDDFDDNDFDDTDFDDNDFDDNDFDDNDFRSSEPYFEETSREIGEYGEDLTASILLSLSEEFGRKSCVFQNIYVPYHSGATTEVDLILLTVKGLFVIESKNYSGAIIGRYTEKYWTQKLYGGETHRFYNPIRQNNTHINTLKKYLNNPPMPFFSWIVFSDRCSLRYVKFRDNDCVVLHRDELFYELEIFLRNHPDVLSDRQFIDLESKLVVLQESREALRKRHYQRETDAICPRCGAQLVLRTAKQGERAGKQFYGCSAFPKCRYVQSID